MEVKVKVFFMAFGNVSLSFKKKKTVYTLYNCICIGRLFVYIFEILIENV